MMADEGARVLGLEELGIGDCNWVLGVLQLVNFWVGSG